MVVQVFTLLLIAKIPLTNKNLYLGLLDKKIMLIFCLLETIFRLPPSPHPLCSKPQKWARFFEILDEKRAHFGDLEDNFEFAAPPPTLCLEKTKYEHYFFIKHPLLSGYSWSGLYYPIEDRGALEKCSCYVIFTERYSVRCRKASLLVLQIEGKYRLIIKT